MSTKYPKKNEPNEKWFIFLKSSSRCGFQAGSDSTVDNVIVSRLWLLDFNFPRSLNFTCSALAFCIVKKSKTKSTKQQFNLASPAFETNKWNEMKGKERKRKRKTKTNISKSNNNNISRGYIFEARRSARAFFLWADISYERNQSH